MALMIPAVCPEKPPGERELFRRLRDDPDTNGWIILHSLDLARHAKRISGEADFVIFVPDLGILVIEVKSHRSVHFNEKGWHLGNDPVDPRGPFKQASEAMHSIRKYLSDADKSFSGMIAWSAACFTDLGFSYKSAEWHDWQVIDKSSLRRAPISKIIRNILEEGKRLMIENGISCAKQPEVFSTDERCRSASQVLRPFFEVAVSPKVRRRERDEALLNLTMEQYSALDQIALNKRVILSGPAGSGKTVLAMEALRRSAVSGAFEAPALFCFNRNLGESLKGLAANTGLKAIVANIDAWLVAEAGTKLSGADKKSDDLFNGLLAERAIDNILERNGGPIFDLLILDEAQDLLEPYYLDVFDLILEGGLAGGNLMMFGDFEGQDIFCRSKESVTAFVESRCPSAARFQLTCNCRNTPAISEYVVALGKLAPPYTKVLRPDDRHDPELVFWKDQKSQLNGIKAFIKECIADGFSYQDIILLSPSAENPIARELALDPDFGNRIAPFGKGEGKMSYTTIQKFKGLEAPVVLVTDFSSMEADVQQSLFYIGLSRALHRLGIFLQDDLKKFVRSAI